MSKKYRTETVETEQKRLVSITCDKCLKEIDPKNWEEAQECIHLEIVGGYGSVFSDGGVVKTDICQNCMLAFLESFPNGIPWAPLEEQFRQPWNITEEMIEADKKLKERTEDKTPPAV